MPGDENSDETKGFSYYVSDEQLKEYGSWPLEKRLAWLYAGNKLRKQLPEKNREIQDAFRRGDM